MKLLKQPNKWSCLPTAVAMATGLSFEYIITAVGHDGSEILWPELGEPGQRRSFHIQEMIDVIINQPNTLCTLIEAEPVLVSHPGPILDNIGIILEQDIENVDIEDWEEMRREFSKLMGRVYPIKDRQKTIANYMNRFSGVLLGMINNQHHAVAWNTSNELIYNPVGLIHPNNGSFNIESFLIIAKSE